MSNRLDEGMRTGDLEDMVLPLISADEYKSKVDDTAVVFGFYVNDRDAALDLNRFIQKSPATLLDTEVSPAPDQNGYYMVFFEFLRNDRLPENVREVLDEVEPLTNNTAWQLRIRGVDRLVPFSVAALKAHFTDEKGQEQEKEKSSIEEQILGFLQPSNLSRMTIGEDRLVVEGLGNRFEFEIVSFGPSEALLENQEIGPLGMRFEDAAYEMRLALALGDGWSVHRSGDLNVLLYEWSNDVLLLKT